MRFVPPALLAGIDLMALPLEEFFIYLGRARYVERLEQQLHTKAILDAFGSED